MSVNVNRDVTDVFYRYKMPRIIAKVEGKGNGIKTVIVNMVDVAKALGRPPTYPTKFFGCELGAQTQFDFKNDRYIVNGSHEAGKLQCLLDIFVKKFVLCPKCDNPETELFPNERKGLIKQTCKACGNPGMMIDMTHKLTTFILKNPPDVKPQQQGRSLTRKKDRKKEPEKNGQSKNLLRPGSPSGHDHSDNSDNDLNGVTPIQEDEEWTVCLSKEAVNERMNDLSSGVMSLAMSTDLEKTQGERLEMFYVYCQEKVQSGFLKPGVGLATFKEIASHADYLDIKDSKGVMVLVELLLDENVIKLIPQYHALFLMFTSDNEKSQKYMLGAVEKLIDLHKEALLPRVPVLFKVLYDKDIIDEETFLEWGKKASKKYVSKEMANAIKNKAAPFLKWLREADVESSSSEDDLEIEYSEKALPQSLREQQEKIEAEKNKIAVAAPTQPQDDEEASDVDIDNL